MGTVRRSAILLIIGVFCALAACSEETTSKKAASEDQASQPAALSSTGPSVDLPIGSGFDFYVLALSWSPSYCLAEGEDANRQQCNEDADFAFIVHGLWPQFESGYPEYCSTREPERVPERLGRGLLDIMPSMGLIGHQWRKHGSCSGLNHSDYFATTRAAFERVEIPADFTKASRGRDVDPDQVETEFRAANSGLKADGIAVTCDRSRLREVRICLSKDLNFTSCREVDRKSCRLDSAFLPSAP